MNEWYAKDTSNKIRSVFDARMKDGKRCSGSIPYGYNRVPSDKQALVVDPVAAEVVKRIFFLANEGKSTRAIAEKLTEEKILIPSAYAKEYHPEQYNGQKYSDPFALCIVIRLTPFRIRFFSCCLASCSLYSSINVKSSA